MARIAKAQRLEAQIMEEVRQVRIPLEAEIRLLGSLAYAYPACWILTLGSFQTITQAEPFEGYWIADTKTGRHARERARFEKGFIMRYGGQNFACDVWVGHTLKHLVEVSNTLGIEVANEALGDLVRYGKVVHFVRPDFPQRCPVYILKHTQVADVRQAGYLTEVPVAAGNNRTWREVQAGDRLVPLPPGGAWPKPILVFSSNWLPEELYRRV
jgi:hypothetical protein